MVNLRGFGDDFIQCVEFAWFLFVDYVVTVHRSSKGLVVGNVAPVRSKRAG